MPSPAQEYSLEHHLLDRLKFCGMQRENLADLVSIVVSLQNKYSITPFRIAVHGKAIRDRLTVRFLLESTTLNKLMSILHDTPRLVAITMQPHGLPRATRFEVSLTLGD